MFLWTQITKWVDNRDSKLRVGAVEINHTGYKDFVINPNRISDLKVHNTTKSSFLFSDNHRDRRENNSYIECNSTVAEIIVAHDTAFHSKFITFPFCPKNDALRTPVDTTLDEGDCAYFCRYQPPPELVAKGVDRNDFCWLIYDRKAFKRVEQLVHFSLEDIPDIALTGTTTSTTTTTTTASQ